MKRLLILASKSTPQKDALVKYLQDFLKDKAEVSFASFADITFFISNDEVEIKVNDRDIRDFDLIYFRRAKEYLRIARTLALWLGHLNIRFFDTVFGKIAFFGDKLTSLSLLKVAGLPILPTFFCWRDKIIKYSDEIAEKLNYPLVAKELTRQHGKGVFLIREKSDFENLLKNTGEYARFMFQKHIQIDKEYRLLVLGDKVASLQILRRDLSEFKLKIDWDAKEEFVEVEAAPLLMRDLAIKGTKMMNLQIAGVDAAIERQTGKIWVFEVNRGPGLTYDTNISPDLPQLASFFEKELEK